MSRRKRALLTAAGGWGLARAGGGLGIGGGYRPLTKLTRSSTKGEARKLAIYREKSGTGFAAAAALCCHCCFGCALRERESDAKPLAGRSRAEQRFLALGAARFRLFV